MKEFRIYKPRKTMDGLASKIQFVVKKKGKYDEAMSFWEISKETTPENSENASFDWRSDKNPQSKSITIKLGLPDISSFLLVLMGIQESIKLFHQNKNGNVSINFGKYKDGYSLNVSSQVNGEILKLGHTISAGEGIILEVLFKDYIVKYHEV